MKQNFIFTCLPHKRSSDEGGKLHFSVLVSMKMEPGNPTTLSAFPDIQTWPEKVLNGAFKFRFKNNLEVDAQLTGEKIDPELWKQLMHTGIRVIDFENPPFEKYRVHSYPTKHVNDFIVKNYSKFAVSNPTKLLEVDDFLDENGLGAISRYRPLNKDEYEKLKSTPRRNELDERDVIKRNVDLDNRLKDKLKKEYYLPFNKNASPSADFAQFRDFHKVERNGKEGPLPKIEKPEFEFHDILAVTSSYPQVQRKLSLVLDLSIPYDNSIPTQGEVRLIPELQGLTDPTHISCPATAYEITNKGFYVRSQGNSYFKKGFVALNDPQFTPVQIDVDGAALKLNNLVENKIIQDTTLKVVNINLAGSKTLKAKNLPEEIPEEVGLPTIRSAGIGIAKNGLSEVLHKKFVKADQMTVKLLDQNQMDQDLQLIFPTETLDADDLTEGYRMDIAYNDKPDKWYSLHWKQDQINYMDTNNQVRKVNNIEPDEGFIQLGAAEDTESEGDIFTGEVMFRWEGWSLAVRKPGYAIMEDDEDHETDYVNTDQQIEARKYQMDPDLDFKMNVIPGPVKGTLPKLRFGRKYMIRIRMVDLAGNSVPLDQATEDPSKNVIRSFPYLRYEPVASPILHLGNELKDGEALEHAVIRSSHDLSSEEFKERYNVQSAPDAIRYLLPPKNSQLIAECHGKFDEALGDNSQKASELYQMITSRETLYESGPDGKDKVYSGETIDVLYLPDPMGEGVSLYLAPGYDESHTQEFRPKMYSFFKNEEIWTDDYGRVKVKLDWIDPKPMRVRIREGEINTEWEAGKRLLTVYIPKGQRYKLKYSSWWHPKDIEENSAIWNNMRMENPGNLKELNTLVKTGQHWMISPGRELELVHAVLQPVEPPEILKIITDRDYDQTECLLNVKFKVHGYSTLKLDLMARWQEPIDRPHEVDYILHDRTGVVNDITIDYHDKEKVRGLIPEPENEQQNNQVQFINLKNPALKQQFGDTKHRVVQYQAYGTSRYQEYFDKLILENGLSVERQGAVYEQVIIPSTKRPDPPTVEYVIPTFEWVKNDNPTKMTHIRKGGGLRVYMKRPWFSSGENEKLAVLIRNTKTDLSKTLKANVPENYSTAITQWAVDPIKLSQPPKETGPVAADFRYNPHVDSGLSYPGKEPGKVDAVAYPVEFEPKRKLWFADIRMEPGMMYFPFVKLVLARYQQHSVRKDNRDVCLSKPVFPDFIQLPPTRRCTVDFDKSEAHKKLTVTIEGNLSFISGQFAGPSNYFEVSFLKTTHPQPSKMTIYDETNDKKLDEAKAEIPITQQHISNNYFKVTQEFKLSGSYKHDAYVILVKEFERAKITSPTKKRTTGNASRQSLRDRNESEPRLVYADRFDVNAV